MKPTTIAVGTAAAAAAAAIAYLWWRRTRADLDLCCPPDGLPPLKALSPAEAPAAGEVKDMGGLQVYVIGDEAKARRAIVVATDIWGFEAGRHRQVCDLLAKRLEAVVYLPDFFHGTPCSPEKPPGTPAFGEWVKQYRPDTVSSDLQKVLMRIRPSVRIGCVGFCWGSFASILAQSGEREVHAAALVHPSHRKMLEKVHGASEGQADALIAYAKGATLMLAAGNDDERCKPGGKDEEILRQRGPVRFVEFGEMSHGWVIKGDIAEPAVARDVQRAVGMIGDWFEEHL